MPFCRLAVICAMLFAVLVAAGCAAAPSRALQGNADALGTGQASDADAAAQYHILAGEMAAQRGMPETAARHYVAALKYTRSKKLARRATRMALFAGDPDLAYEAAGQWATLSPDSAAAQRTAARLALIEGESDALLRYSRSVVRTADTNDDGYRLLADVLSGKPVHGRLAVQTLQQIARENAGSASAWYALGLVSLRYDKPQIAADAAKHAAALEPSWDDARILQAAIRIRLGQPDRAQAIIENLPGSKQQRSQYHLTLAQLLLDGAQPEAALGEFRRALALQPDNADARYGLAVLALSLDRLDQAETAFKQLYHAQRHTEEAAYYLGTIYEQHKSYDTAERWYRRVTSGRHLLAAKINAARMRARLGDLNQARAEMRTLRAQYPQMSDRLYAAEGQMLFSVGHYRDARSVYDAALSHDPKNIDLLYERSIVNEKLGRIEAAKADLKAVLARKPNNARALNALGYLLTNHSSRYERALQLITKALRLDPENPAILDSAGWAYFHLGRINEALAYLQRAYMAFPDPEVAAHLGEVLWQLGRHEQARRIWHKALAANPDDAVLRRTIARFTGSRT